MKRVFADTFYFLALLNPGDQAHSRAIVAACSFQGELVTTCWVLTELADAMSSPPNRNEFISTLNDLRTSPQVRIYEPEPQLYQQGIQLFADRSDKHWSLTDCISFVVMKQEGISEALTGDRHFEQAGFVALLK
ncbi:MAG: PIN domain-containing protein [Gemmatales bacterium]